MPYPDDDFEDFMDDQEACDLCGGTDCTCDECCMMPDGTCTLAGTEHCEWDCTNPSKGAA